MNMLIITVVGFLALTCCALIWRLWASHKAKAVLQQKLSVVESAVEALSSRLANVEELQREELSQDQAEYRDKLQAQYAVLFQQIQDAFKAEIKTVKAEAVGTVQKCRTDFDKLLKTEFEKACEKIRFDEIEYKKTITKKRREFNRKNSHKAKPAKIWRSIMDE